MFRFFLRISPVLFLIWILIWVLFGLENSGLFLIGFFILLGIGLRSKESLKGLSFPVLIFGVVAAALFFPQYFQEIKSYSLSNLITPLIQVIMFGMGTSLSLRDFSEVIKSPNQY